MFSSLGAPKSILDDRVFVKVLPQQVRNIPKDQPRTVADSWVRWNLPMRSHPQMFEQFSLFGTDQIRVGKVLEILDAFSAEVGYRHIGFAFDDHTIVTACLDRLDFFDKLSMKEDLQVEGFVTRVGNSSIDVQVDLSAEKSGYIGKAVFLLVSRDMKKDIAKTVPRLVTETKDEKERERISAISREIKKKQSQASVWKIPPTADESRIIHGLFRKYRESADGFGSVIPMSKTIVSKTLIMQRQYRNIHNKIFGGYLTREAYELAWVCAYRFAKCPPAGQHMDDINFLKPVEVGSIVTFSSQLVYASELASSVIVRVNAQVENPQTGESHITNEFFFEFSFPQLETRVHPETYEEAMLFLDGRRRYHLISSNVFS